MKVLGLLVPETTMYDEFLVLLTKEEYRELLTLREGTGTGDNIPILKGLRRRVSLAKLVKHLETLTEVLARQEGEP